MPSNWIAITATTARVTPRQAKRNATRTKRTSDARRRARGRVFVPRADAAILAVARFEQSFGRLRFEPPQSAFDRVVDARDEAGRVAVRAAQRLGHDLVDDAETLEGGRGQLPPFAGFPPPRR